MTAMELVPIKRILEMNNEFVGHNKLSGEDPEFHVGGDADRRGRQHMTLSYFPKNCMKSRKCWAVGGDGPWRPPWIHRCL